MRWQWFVALAVGLLLAADTPKEDPAKKKDSEKLQGAWKGDSGEVDGNALPDEFLKAAKFGFKGDKYTFEAGDEKESGTITLDASKTPATIDLKIEEGRDKGKTQLGIYKVEGDKVKFCFGQPDAKERPKDFSSKAGSDTIYIVFKREQL